MEREVIVPPEQEGGAYAHYLNVWHTAHEFTLDFAVALTDDDAAPFVAVSRVRLPVTMMFELIRDANAELTKYEARFGEIRPPEEAA
jgi:hypothetical protein